MSEIKEEYKLLKKILDAVFVITGVTALALIIIIIGFYLGQEQTTLLILATRAIIITYVVQEIIRWFIVKNKSGHLRSRLVENILAAILVTQLLLHGITIDYLQNISLELELADLSFAYIAVLQLVIFTAFVVRILRHSNLLANLKMHPGMITAISFAVVIIAGSLFLMLPKATVSSSPIKYVDALFTSTSAVCVTGLVSVNTATEFTTLGRIIIICLIQIGGIGVMTLSSFFASLLFGGLSFRMKIMVKDMLSEDNLSEVSDVLKKITLFTFSFELVGALLLYLSLGGGAFSNFNFATVKNAAFHSVAAFCNAGFSIYSTNLMAPEVQQNYFFLSVIMLLILFGGIGFLAFSNMFTYIFFRKKIVTEGKYRLQLTTRIVFITTFAIIIIGTLALFFTESYPSEKWMTTGDRLFHSLFMVITARTAGFNTTNIAEVTNIGLIVIIFIMWIGASPGSTGGGIKTTTFAILILHFVNYMRGKDHLEIFHRRVYQQSINKAVMVQFAAGMVLILLTSLLVAFEKQIPLMDLLFEAVSAISTTGLSTGITGALKSSSKYTLIILMYLGRIGVLSFLVAFFPAQPELKYNLPEEKILVG